MSGSKKLQKALDLARNGQFQDAIAIYSDLVEHDVKMRLPALGNRAWLYRGMFRYEDALQDYDRLVESDAKNLEAKTRRAETLLLCGRIHDAAKASINVLSFDPMYTLALQVLQDCQKAAGLNENKRISFPFPSYMERPLNPIIEKLESEKDSFPVSIFPGLGRLLYTFVRCCRPQKVIETGTNIGYSALCIAQGLADNGTGHLYSFDLFENSPDQLSLIRKRFENAGLAKWASFHKGDSSTMIERIFNAENHIDLAFIDGDHTLKGCMKDWYAVDDHLLVGGIVLLHDTQFGHCQWLGPKYLLEELSKRGHDIYQVINMHTSDGCGLGIIQKNGVGQSLRWMPSFKELIIQRLYHQIIDIKRKLNIR